MFRSNEAKLREAIKAADSFAQEITEKYTRIKRQEGPEAARRYMESVDSRMKELADKVTRARKRVK
jgi:hypothetical protein